MYVLSLFQINALSQLIYISIFKDLDKIFDS